MENEETPQSRPLSRQALVPLLDINLVGQLPEPAARKSRPSSRMSVSSASSALLDSLQEELAETERLMAATRQQQSEAAAALEGAVGDREAMGQALLQHARAASRRLSAGSPTASSGASASQGRAGSSGEEGPAEEGQQYQDLLIRYQAECEVRQAAQQLLWELQEEYHAAVDELGQERAAKDEVLRSLEGITARYAGLAEGMAGLLPHDLLAEAELDYPGALLEDGEEATFAGGSERAAPGVELESAAEGALVGKSEGESGEEGQPGPEPGAGQGREGPVGGPEEEETQQQQGAGAGSEEPPGSLTALQAAYAALRRANGVLQAQVQRAQLERDAVLDKLDAVEGSLASLQQAVADDPQLHQLLLHQGHWQWPAEAEGSQGHSEGEDESEGGLLEGEMEQQQAEEQAQQAQQARQQRQQGRWAQVPHTPHTPCSAASPATTVAGGDQAPTPPGDRGASLAATPELPFPSPAGSLATGGPAGALRRLGDLVEGLGQRQEGLEQSKEAAAADAAGAGGAATVAGLRRHVEELQARSALVLEELAAGQAVARQLQGRLGEERRGRTELEGRLAAAQRECRGAERQHQEMAQHIQELQELVEVAIDEADSTRLLLQRVTAAEEGGGQKLKLGELWTKLMEAEERATSALRPAKSPKGGAGGEADPRLYEVWRMLEESGGRRAGGGSQVDEEEDLAGKAARRSALRSRLAALNSKFSHGGAGAGSPASRPAGRPAVAGTLQSPQHLQGQGGAAQLAAAGDADSSTSTLLSRRSPRPGLTAAAAAAAATGRPAQRRGNVWGLRVSVPGDSATTASSGADGGQATPYAGSSSWPSPPSAAPTLSPSGALYPAAAANGTGAGAGYWGEALGANPHSLGSSGGFTSAGRPARLDVAQRFGQVVAALHRRLDGAAAAGAEEGTPAGLRPEDSLEGFSPHVQELLRRALESPIPSAGSGSRPPSAAGLSQTPTLSGSAGLSPATAETPGSADGQTSPEYSGMGPGTSARSGSRGKGPAVPRLALPLVPPAGPVLPSPARSGRKAAAAEEPPYFKRELPPPRVAAQWLAGYWWVNWLVPQPLRLLCANITLWLLQPFSLLLLSRWSACAAAGGSGLLGLAFWLALAPQPQQPRRMGMGRGAGAVASRARSVGMLVLYGLGGRRPKKPGA